ncbi:CobQ/CobB/MinD/ParA nucleotide binding domain protein [compost metagenome]
MKRSRTASVPKEETLLLGVVSASGSSGKTTLALNMAKQLGGLGLSVFYLNLESVDSSGLFLRMPDGNPPGLERLLYELKAGGGEGGQAKAEKLELEKYVIRHESLRSEAFRPVENLKEKLEMTLTDTLEVLEQLSGAGRYDVVIVDAGSIEEQQTQAVLHRCGLLLWVLTGDKSNMYKTERWLEHCSRPYSGLLQDVPGKSRFVMNFAADAISGGLLPEAMRMDAVLPYISSWAMQHHGELCLNSPQFILGIQQLCSGIIEPALPRVFTGNVYE